MLKFLKSFFSKKATKPQYTICERCGHYKMGYSDFPGSCPDTCYAKVVVKEYLSFITGSKYTNYDRKPEICAEKNTGHCPDFEKRRSLFNS